MSHQVQLIRVDENHPKLNLKPIFKKSNLSENPPTRRAALGELGNKVKNTVLDTNKKSENDKKNLNDVKSNNTLKLIKPRVDTHWKNAIVPTKRVTRTDSIKSTNTSGPITSNVLATALLKQKATAPKLVKTKTIHATKPEEVVKIQISKSKKTSNKENVTEKVENTVISVRREESNLTRRSLTKIRAAISKEFKVSKTVTEIKKADSITIESPSHSTILLNDVENIDLNDDINPILVSEYVKDIYNYMHSLENSFPLNENHLNNQLEVTPKMRAVLIDWINEVHYQFHLVQETFHMAVSIIDRFLQAVKTTSRKNLQLVGVTALLIASKYEELYPPAIADYVYITDNTYTKEEILKMEKFILKKLDFHLSRPLPIHFLRRFSKAAKGEGNTHLMSKYFIEIASVEYTMVHYKPSEIAAASLCLTLICLSIKSRIPGKILWTRTLEYYSTYSYENIQPIMKRLTTIIEEAPNSKLKAIFIKYKLPKFESISQKEEISKEYMKQVKSLI